MSGNPLDGIALVLPGGGARAAYQAGVLRAISELIDDRGACFPIITGVSAGSINGASLACRAHDLRSTIYELWRLWADLTPEKVFRTDTLNLAGIGLKWFLGLSLRGAMGRQKPNYLLDTSPLRKTLSSHLDFKRLEENIRTKVLQGVAFSTVNYQTGATVTFYAGEHTRKHKLRHRHAMIKTRLSVDHVLASSAIPILFRPIAIDGNYFGDGGIRFLTPLSPAIHLGAQRILAIGIRQEEAITPWAEIGGKHKPRPPSLADLAGTLLNAIFLEGLEMDAERLERINHDIELLADGHYEASAEQLRQIPIFYIRPSEDLGRLAYQLHQKFPQPLKYLLQGLGASRQRGWDFLSYLSFDSTYTLKLLELGYRDMLAQAEPLKAFLSGADISKEKKGARKTA